MGGGPHYPLHSTPWGVQPNMSPSSRPRIARSTAPPAHRGRGGPHYPLHPTPWGVQPSMPPSSRPRIAGVHRASCPLRAGGTTLSSPPHSVGCLTKHATNKTPQSGCPPRLLPIAGGGDHPLFSTPLRGVSNPTCLQQDPVLWTGSTAPPAHCGLGDHPLFSTPLRGVSNPTCLQQDPV